MLVLFDLDNDVGTGEAVVEVSLDVETAHRVAPFPRAVQGALNAHLLVAQVDEQTGNGADEDRKRQRVE